jgi:hypothetical protein
MPFAKDAIPSPPGPSLPPEYRGERGEDTLSNRYEDVMKRRMILVLAIAVWWIPVAALHAQAPIGGFGGGVGNISRPTVSPYLNIIRGGDPAINYYGLVRPQIAFSRAFQAVDNSVVALQADANQPSQTGQRSSFMTQSRYFMNNSAPSRPPQQQQQTPQRPQSRGR